ncbi:hypothetical protein [Klebsiella phage vB_KpnS-VAC35]|uniref:Uncharacterized protein n=1 Tax=Klebsiella phage vB_KpnS-VAC35 TaxID=2866696 RepID=A0AAE9C5B7_9CAUD|nr:hypothetical protein [Klebsiella phage vB_KpnS-VAC35]
MTQYLKKVNEYFYYFSSKGVDKTYFTRGEEIAPYPV